MCDELNECAVETTHSSTPVRREDRSGRLLHFYIWSGNHSYFLCKGTDLSSSRCSPSSRRHDRSSYGILQILDEFCTAQHLHRKLNVNGRIRLSQTHRRIKLFATTFSHNATNIAQLGPPMALVLAYNLPWHLCLHVVVWSLQQFMSVVQGSPLLLPVKQTRLVLHLCASPHCASVKQSSTKTLSLLHIEAG
jgi:hypothetical protein